MVAGHPGGGDQAAVVADHALMPGSKLVIHSEPHDVGPIVESAGRSDEAHLTGGYEHRRRKARVAEVDDEFEQTRKRARRGGILEQPSPAELAVLRLLPSDLSMRQIGAELFLSPNTVHTHTRAIYRKLGVGSRAEAVARATTRGLLDESRSPG